MTERSPNPYPQPPPDELSSLFPEDPRPGTELRTLVMGVLNVTPDSFSDGGRFYRAEDALAQGRRMIEEGADLLDVGGESTRPGAETVTEAEEMRRALPAIEALAHETSLPLSIDTTRSNVARAAVRLGARMINDVSGLRFDPDIARVAAETDAFLVIMHSRGEPKTMSQDNRYDDLIGEIAAFLARQADEAMARGVRRERIILDPGIGFAKVGDQNLELLRRQREWLGLGFPLLVGPSRKSFIGRILGGVPPEERVAGTAGAVALAVAGGARIVRVHDVGTMVDVARVADAICRPGVSGDAPAKRTRVSPGRDPSRTPG
jgi:dihydropteroate synthase